MNAATTTREQGQPTSGCRNETAESSGLLPVNICGENKRELKSHAAELLAGGFGIDTGTKSEGDDADAGLPPFGLSCSHSDVKFNKLHGEDSFKIVFRAPKIKAFWPGRNANGCWADAGNLLRGIIDAVVNFGQGLGNKVLEVHG